MKKLMVPFLLFTLIFYFGYYFFMSDVPAAKIENTAMVLRVTGGGKPIDCTLSFLDTSGGVIIQGEQSKQRMTLHDLPEGTVTMRVGYFAGEDYGRVETDIPLTYRQGEGFQLFLDFSGVEYTRSDKIEYMDYVKNFIITQPLFILFCLAWGLVAYLYFLLVPLSFFSLLLSYARESAKNLPRRFAGSVIYGLIGCAALLAGCALGFTDRVNALPDCAAGLVRFLMPGYPLYIFAYRVFDRDKVAPVPDAPGSAEWDFQRFNYHEYHYLNRPTFNTLSAAWNSRKLVSVIFWLIGAVILPVSTFHHIFTYYTLPLLSGRRTWKDFIQKRARRPALPDWILLGGEHPPDSWTASEPVLAGDLAFARCEADDMYYPCEVIDVQNGFADVLFTDGQREWVPMCYVYDVGAIGGMELQGNRENRGYFFSCEIQGADERNNLIVAYNKDGAVEHLSLSALRGSF